MAHVVHGRVADELRRRGLSWTDLARRSGLPARVVGRLRRPEGNPPLAVAERVAAALDVPVETLWALRS